MHDIPRAAPSEPPRARTGAGAPPPLARIPVVAALVALAAVLAAFSDRYDYHRDELYFRMLRPAWGYVDEPPLSPLLVRTLSHVADAPWAVRLPATLAAAASVLVVALVTRELGGGRGAQALCAWAYGFAVIPLIFGHVMLTSSLDLLVWPTVTLLIMRALLREQPGWWLAAGAVVGLSTYNKLLVVTLLVALGAGLLACGPRRALWSPWVLAAGALALALGAPNLVYQATHDWPQLAMGRALSAHNASDVRVTMWPMLLLLLGPPLVPVWVAGLVALWRRERWRAVRGLSVGFVVLLAIVFTMGSQSYYPAGLLAVLFAAGCVPTWEWLRRGRRRRWAAAALVALNAAVSLVLALPIVPLSSVGATPIPGIDQTIADQVGWPRYVAEVRAVARRLPPADRSRAIVLASNYGEAGAVARYGRDLPPVYSGHNALWDQGRPPQARTVAIFLGGQVDDAARLFATCRRVGSLDDRVGVDNEEQGQPIDVCRDPLGGWRTAWPRLRHLD
jgi:4-amino-4-deoxy-L-arabinose transferase-like glycosyltransferase